MLTRPRLLALATAAALALPSAAMAKDKKPKPAGHGMVVAGVTLIVASAAAYVLMAAGLGLGNQAEGQIRSQQGPDQIDRRRELIQRGTLGNRMAIGSGVTAAALLAAGIPLVVVGRRRAQRDLQAGAMPVRGGFGLSLRARF